MTLDWARQRVWITGATSGLGRALALTLGQQGTSLVLSGRNADALTALASELGPLREGQTVDAVAFDLAEKQNYQTLVTSTVAKTGRIDIMVHNAGLSQKGFFRETEAEVEETLWRVNYQSTVELTKALLPYMIEWGGGQIVVVGSIAGRYGAPYLTTYSATKHALYGFYESLRYEVEQHGVSVLMVTPGFIKTDIARKALNERGEAALQDSKAQANGIPPAQAAQKMVKAMSKKKNGTLYIGKLELLFLPISQLSPRLFYWLIKKLHQL